MRPCEGETHLQPGIVAVLDKVGEHFRRELFLQELLHKFIAVPAESKIVRISGGNIAVKHQNVF